MYEFHQRYEFNFSDQQMLIFGGIFLFFFVGLVLFLLRGFALMKMAKKCGIKNGWLAFVPVASTYMYGKIAFSDKIKSILFISSYIVSAIISIIYYYQNVLHFFNGTTYSPSFNIATNIFQWIFLAFSYYATYKIFKKFSAKAVLMTVLSVLSCGLLSSIFLFAIKDNELISIPQIQK